MAKKKYAEGCTIGPGETLAPDLRRIPLKGTNDLVIVRLKLPLRDGDFAVLIGARGVRVGRYYSGPPRRFAEFADPWQATGLGKPLPIATRNAELYRAVEIHRCYPPLTKRKHHRAISTRRTLKEKGGTNATR